MGDSRPAKNKELFEKLEPAQRRKLISKGKCLVCATTEPCATKEYKVQCVTGLQIWLELDADVENWKVIRAFLNT